MENSVFNFEAFDILISIFIIIFALPFHNIIQANVANQFGDNTALVKGFGSANPLVHVDIPAMLALMLYGFCWTRPVPRTFSAENTKHPKLVSAITTLSGTFFYLVFAFILILISHIAFPDITSNRELLLMVSYSLEFPLFSFLTQSALTLISLFFIQLLPIYPFDAGELVGLFIPGKIYWKIRNFVIKHEGLVIILFLLFGMTIFGFLKFMLANNLYFFFDQIAVNILNLF